VPKRENLVAVEIMMSALDKAKIDKGTYFALLNQYHQEARKHLN